MVSHQRSIFLLYLKVDILKNYKKDAKERQYPVYKLKNAQDPNKIEAYNVRRYIYIGLWADSRSTVQSLYYKVVHNFIC